MNEAEIPSIIYRCFTTLGLQKFVIRVNNRKVLTGLFELSGVGDKAGDVMRIIDKLEKIGKDKVLKLLEEDAGLGADQAEQIVDILTCQERGDDPIEKLTALKGRNETFDLGLSELSAVTKYMGDFGRARVAL